MTYYVGVDPGKGGAVAVVGPLWRADACRLSLPHRQIFEWLSKATEGCECVAYLEHVHALPTDARSSAFKFGASYGACQMLLASVIGHYEIVKPLKWQNLLNARTGGSKKVSRDICRQRWPELDIYHWNADAYLICEYAKRVTENAGDSRNG